MTENACRVIEKDGYFLTNHRVLCRRGVMWLGQTCNLRCNFCYFLDRINDKAHPEHAFMSLEKAKEMCRTMVEVYGNNSVDIQGGEPTIYRHIYDLLAYCRDIGLKPTLITNAIVLDSMERCKKLVDAGLFDLLVSVQGIGDVYDKVVGVPNGSKRQLTAIDNLQQAGIPFRINTVLYPEVLHQLADVGKLAIAKGARAVNFIAFNPFIDQSLGDKRSEANVPKYSRIVESLLPVIDRLSEAEIEVNVRYLPFCLFPEPYRKHVQNFQQIIYDLHEWESASEIWSGAGPQRMAESELEPPTDFYHRIQNLRCTNEFAHAPSTRFDANLDRVMKQLAHLAKKHHADDRMTIGLFGNAKIGERVIGEVLASEALSATFEVYGFISTDSFRTADELHGFPWHSDSDLAKDRPDVVVNCSDTFRNDIDRIVTGAAPDTRLLHFFADADSPSDFEPVFYVDELGEVEGFTQMEYAYKEYRVLMPKFMHPYSKSAQCAECSVNGICDGFHADYARFHGFDEIRVIDEGRRIFDPRHYMSGQMKVVEDEERDWALPVV
ncbi:MAG: radical SAM protein [Gammaproteobacteria bacterium]|nr:radical SAM protein [Gammaproteobacteria bacterium]